MIKYLLILTFLATLASCSNSKVEIKNDSGKVTESYEVNKEGEKHGKYTAFYDDGKINEEATYINGVLTGKRIIYHPNGKVEIEETYDDKGVMNGPYKSYFESGVLELEKEYKDNMILGAIKVYYPSGSIKEEVSMENNTENGPFTEYHENGKVHWKGTYRNGDNKYGILYQFDSLGGPIKIMKYDTLAICRTIWKPGMPEINVDTVKI